MPLTYLSLPCVREDAGRPISIASRQAGREFADELTFLSVLGLVSTANGTVDESVWLGARRRAVPRTGRRTCDTSCRRVSSSSRPLRASEAAARRGLFRRLSCCPRPRRRERTSPSWSLDSRSGGLRSPWLLLLPSPSRPAGFYGQRDRSWRLGAGRGQVGPRRTRHTGGWFGWERCGRRCHWTDRGAGRPYHDRLAGIAGRSLRACSGRGYVLVASGTCRTTTARDGCACRAPGRGSWCTGGRLEVVGYISRRMTAILNSRKHVHVVGNEVSFVGLVRDRRSRLGCWTITAASRHSRACPVYGTSPFQHTDIYQHERSDGVLGLPCSASPDCGRRADKGKHSHRAINKVAESAGRRSIPMQTCGEQ